jgi:glucose/arabinose dehydrogenase
MVNSACAQQTVSEQSFAAPLEATKDVVTVDFVEFARIPDIDHEAPRLMHMTEARGVDRYFFSTMRGQIYGVSRDGKAVTLYLDTDRKWGMAVEFTNSELGLQSIAFHPDFAKSGRPGFGKFYTLTDTTDTAKTDYSSGGKNYSHNTALLEWTAKDPQSPTYDGGPPRVMLTLAQPFANHNGGEIAFNPVANEAEAGLLYVGMADGGSGGDPMNLAQNLNSPFGKILRIDPLGTNSKNGRYGIPASNPYANDGKDDTLGEIYARGVRNPQRFTWDSKTGRMYVADIGQGVIEEISPVTAGANLGWNKWEGSLEFIGGRQVDRAPPRSAPGMTWPIAEYDHDDPLLRPGVAVTGVAVYRDTAIPQLNGLLIFGDNPSGEMFYIKADAPAHGGPSAIRRILLNESGKPKTLLQLINEKTGMKKARADLRYGFGAHGEVFIMNKQDGVIRQLVAKR